MSYDIAKLFIKQALDACELYERRQISLAVAVHQVRQAYRGLPAELQEGCIHWVDLLDSAQALAEERQRFSAEQATRELRKALTIL